MKILNRSEFLALPEGVLYSKFQYSIMNGLTIKYDTLGNDFVQQDLIDTPFSLQGDYSDMDENYKKSHKRDISFQLDYDCAGRDGLFEENQLFAVYEKEDVEKLMAELGTLVETYPAITRDSSLLVEESENPFLEKVKKRLETTKDEDWVEYKGPEHFYELIMKKKKELGLKFKDEK